MIIYQSLPHGPALPREPHAVPSHGAPVQATHPFGLRQPHASAGDCPLFSPSLSPLFSPFLTRFFLLLFNVFLFSSFFFFSLSLPSLCPVTEASYQTCLLGPGGPSSGFQKDCRTLARAGQAPCAPRWPCLLSFAEETERMALDRPYSY